MKIKKIQGELTDISAKKAALLRMLSLQRGRGCTVSLFQHANF